MSSTNRPLTACPPVRPRPSLSAAASSLILATLATVAAEREATVPRCDGCGCRLYVEPLLVDGEAYCLTCSYDLASATVDGVFGEAVSS